MTTSLATTVSTLIQKQGFAFAPASDMRAILEQQGSLADWNKFADSWDDLKTDTYMADKGRYRKRRYAVYTATDGRIKREAHQAHFQTLDYNPLHGDIERWFEPIHDTIGNSQSMQTVLKFCCGLFGALLQQKLSSPPPFTGGVRGGLVEQETTSPAKTKDLAKAKSKFSLPLPQGERAIRWHIETHQFRIEAKTGEKGQPTPEGMHRDGRDYVLVLLIRRQNIQSGVTTIHDLEKKQLGSFTLTEPFDAALVDDARVYHGVTAVTPLDPALPAYRDVLVVTFKAI